YLDYKAAGGYVLAPPSVVHGRAYELLDHRAGTARLDWQAVRALLDPPQRSQDHRPEHCARRGHAGHLAEWVAALPEGNRNAGLFWAACRVEDGHGREQL